MSELIPKHGGYRNLKSFQVSQLVYDITVRFCDKYIEKRSRTHDQMVQAARSGVQNIAEGSQASATSKKMEIKLTQVARASLEELKLDYEDFLRHRTLPLLEPSHPALLRFKAKKPQTVEAFAGWVQEEREIQTKEQGLAEEQGLPEEHGLAEEQGLAQTGMDKKSSSSVPVHESPPKSLPVHETPPKPVPSLSSACLAANGALSLLNLACYFLDRQVERLAKDFEQEGGFTERLYKIRTAKRRERS